MGPALCRLAYSRLCGRPGLLRASSLESLADSTSIPAGRLADNACRHQSASANLSVKIAILGLRAIGPSASGGIEKAIEELSTRFARSGHHVTVYCLTQLCGRRGRIGPRGVRIQTLPAIYTKHLEAISNTVAAIFCTLRGYDVIHINAIGPALLSFVPRLFGRKVIVTVHGLDWKREKCGSTRKVGTAARCMGLRHVSQPERRRIADARRPLSRDLWQGRELPTSQTVSIS